MSKQPSSPVRDITRDLLRDLGLTTVFGNPGSTELGFLSAWPDDFRYVLALQELCAVAMADGYAQFTGNAALVNLHSIGGVGHAMGAIATAYHNHSPLVILAGQQSRALLGGEPFLGGIDPTTLVKPYVRWAVQPARAADVPAAIQRAYLVATTPPCGPTLVSVPADDWEQPGAPITPRPRLGGIAPDPERLAEVVEALAVSQHPALVLGGAVDADGASADAVALAEALGARVYAAPMTGRCSFPEDHRLFGGFLNAAHRNLAIKLSGHDLVVVVGAPAFVEHVVSDDPGPELPALHVISADANELSWAPEGVGLNATPRLALRGLLAGWGGRVSRTEPTEPAAVPVPEASQPISASYVLSVISEVQPADAIVVEEIPSHRPALHRHLPIRRPGGFFTGQSGVLGFALPAAIGVALAQPDRPVLALLGDGSSLYSIQGLWTAVQQRVNVTFVIFDNGQYGALRALAEGAGYAKVPGTELGGTDFRLLAQAWNCPAENVTDPADLAPILRTALATPGPALIRVALSADYHALY
ncbi:MAG TPA: benzoylformate decarboxylase [Pseudonocardiaceae bacterium]|jgi:benzoylformate decarboxylase|nr:benzoylformate decarboxylase [Pseudonocardiaceae bacterium]